MGTWDYEKPIFLKNEFGKKGRKGKKSMSKPQIRRSLNI